MSHLNSHHDNQNTTYGGKSYAELKPPGGATVCRRGWSGVAAELAKLALVNQVDDVTTDQLMTTLYRFKC